MKKIAFLSTVLLLLACSSDSEFTEPIESNPLEIKLSGTFTTASVDSRGTGPFTGDNKPTKNMSLRIFRADATSGVDFSGVSYASTLITDTIPANTDAITMTPKQYYLSERARATKLIALHPSGGTFTASSGTVKFDPLDGGTDIMCSALVQGNRETQVTSMTFKHLLTQVQVWVKASSPEAATVWGDVQSITIADKKIGVVVTLPVPNTSGTATIAADSGGTPDVLSLTKADGTAPSTSQALTTTEAIYGYGMFLPVTTAGTLKFNIKTANGGTQTLTTTSQSFEAGKAYKMIITFSISDVSLKAILTDWTDGGSINGTL